MSDMSASLIKSSVVPAEKKAYEVWLEQEDALSLLEANPHQDDFVVFASLMHAFVHAVLVPDSLVSPPNIEDLMSWNFNAHTSWGISYASSDPPSISVSPPLDHTGSNTIDQGEQLVFSRSF